MSVNKVILVGNVGKDPEIRYFENDRAVANFSIATTERAFTTSSGQQIAERTEWHNLVVWGGLSKVVESYVKKGSQLYIEGKLRSRSWDDKDGNKKYTTEVYVDSLQILGRKSDGTSGSSSTNAPGGSSMPQSPVQQPISTPPISSLNYNNNVSEDSSEEDDLPF